MGGSSSKAKQFTSRDKAILEVKVQRDRLKQYQKKLTGVLERETEIAKHHYNNGNRELALLALKKKRHQQQLLEQTHGQLLNLEQLVQSIEYAQVEVQVVQGLKTGNKVLAELQKEMKVEDVELLMEETAEAIAYQKEISELLSGEMVGEDEDELLEELAQLQGEPLEEEKQSVSEEEAVVLPSVPETEPTPSTVTVEEENNSRRVVLTE